MEIVVSVRKITLHTIPEALVLTVALMVVLVLMDLKVAHHTNLVNLACMVAHTADLFLHTILVNLALMVPMVALLPTIPAALVHTADLFHRTILVNLAHSADLFHRTILVALARTVDLARFLEPLPELMKRPKP
jgi:hypothetical protein